MVEIARCNGRNSLHRADIGAIAPHELESFVAGDTRRYDIEGVALVQWGVEFVHNVVKPVSRRWLKFHPRIYGEVG